ncbi:MAG: beta-ketoacyl-ACP synthase III [Pseudomonadota bacterium]
MTNAVYITEIAAFLPNEAINNSEIEDALGYINGTKSRAKSLILRSNGIKNRYYAIDRESGVLRYTNAQMTAEAIRGLASTNFKLNDIDCISCGTSSPDQLAPGHGVMVHGELGTPACEVNTSSGICAAGITALKFAYLEVLCGGAKNAVASGSELVSSFMLAKNFKKESESKLKELEQRPEIAFEKDFLRWMLSDGAGAVLLQDSPNTNGPSLRIEWIEILSQAGSYETCMYGGAIKREDGTLQGWREFDTLDEVVEESVLTVKQDVKLLNDNIVSATVEQVLPGIMEKHGLSAEDIDYFLPHMSSEYFRPRLAKGLENIGYAIPQEKWFTNLSEKGNVGSASIYIMLEELFHSGRLKAGEKILCFVPESGRFSTSFTLLTVV